VHLVAIGGSDAGISAALRAREFDPKTEVTVVVADRFPNFSICGIPYYVSGEVTHWSNLAHRTIADLEDAGMTLRLDTVAFAIDAENRKVQVRDVNNLEVAIPYDGLVVGTGAVSVRPPIDGIDGIDGEKCLDETDGVHLLHSMGDTFAIMKTLEESSPASALIVGAGYIGLEMAEALIARGLEVTQIEQLTEVLPTVDSEIGSLVNTELAENGVGVITGTRVTSITQAATGSKARLEVQAVSERGSTKIFADMVLVVVGVRPDAELAASCGVETKPNGAIIVDKQMRTNLPGIWAAGDCVVTHHRLLGETYLPLGTTAHKQGRVAGENALGGSREFAGSMGTQVVKIFDSVAARTGLRDSEARTVGFDPVTVASQADDHKAYYPGSNRISIRYTGDRVTRRLLGVQLFGNRRAEIAKRIDIAATAIFNEMRIDDISDLDLSYTPPLGCPWDAMQVGAEAWVRARN